MIEPDSKYLLPTLQRITAAALCKTFINSFFGVLSDIFYFNFASVLEGAFRLVMINNTNSVSNPSI